jgi:proton-translocating NADH-quinone oxidoreductase chain L
MGLDSIVLTLLQHGAEAAKTAGHAAAPENHKILYLIPLLPMFGFLFQVFIGRKAPKPVVGFVSCGVIAGAAAIAWWAFAQLLGMDPHHRVLVADLGPWIQVPGVDRLDGWMRVLVPHKLVVDPLTSVMTLVVTNIAFFIHVYSTGYMAEEKRFARYFSYLNLFTGFMLVLVMGSSLLLMFVGWEGVGLCSYLLIGFWFEKKENAAAGMKAFIVNRVGDLAFTIGVLLLFVTLGTKYGVWTVDFDVLKEVVGAHKAEIAGSGLATAVCILLFIGATGKSAQIPLYTWLPDAMAGPTPVSALIHAATMVTAGVYMIARMNFLFALSPTAMCVVATVGAATALFAGSIGLTQNDIKKVLAYSTVSQLGFMFMAVGVGAFAAGVFHLFTHAFFKACLFLGSGSVIHGMGGEQDIRKMGGLKKKMPWTWATFGISTLAIAGIPPFAGFFSKDEILWQAWSTHAFPNWWGKVIWAVGAVSALCTAFYMTRLVVKTFYGRPMWGAAGAFSGGGAGHGKDDDVEPLPDDASLLDLGAVGKKKPAPKPAPEDDVAALPDDASLLDLGAVGKKKGAPAPRPSDDDVQALPDDASLLDLGAVGKRKPAPPPQEDTNVLDMGPAIRKGMQEEQAKAAAAHDAHAHAAPAASHDAHAHDSHGHDSHGHDTHAHDAHGHDAHAAGHGDDAGHGGGHGHGHGEPHECPWSMRIALVVLAACAVVVGFLGVPPALSFLGLPVDLFGHWLEPVVGSAHPPLKPGEAPHHDPWEYVLMLGSIGLAAAGIWGAWRIYQKRAGVPAQDFAQKHPELYQLVLDKYRVDELYDATVVQPTLTLNEAAAVFDAKVIDGAVNGAAGVGRGVSGAVGGFDNEVVDGAVNAAATVTLEAGRRVRRVQTGNIRDYLTIALVGALFVIAVFCLWLTLGSR